MDEPATDLASVVSDCVHCGFCLPACPTYQLWGEEMDSPRGRIHLIGQVVDGAPLSAAAVEHFDRCLGCMACMPACPSGVRYNVLIEAARAWTDDTGPAPGAAVSEPGTAGAGGLAAGTPEPGAVSSATGGAPPDQRAPRPGPVRSRRERAFRAAIFATFPYPRRLRALTGPLRLSQRAGLDRWLTRGRAARWLPPEFAAALRVAPRPGPRAPALPGRIPARGQRRAVVGMLTGCVQDVFFSEVNRATARVLAAEGCDVIIPARQGCCGALSLHSGRATEAAGFARRAITEFEQAGVDTIVINSAGCGSAMKEYGALLGGGHGGPADGGSGDSGDGWAARAAEFSGKVRDLSEFLAELYEQHGGPRATRHELAITAVYHDACHLAHAQRIRQQPRDLLRGIPGMTVAEVADGGACCGSAGVYNLLQPKAAVELGQRKAAAIRATEGRLVVSANPGCSLQIGAALAADGGAPLQVVHLAQVLDASLRGLPVSSLTS
ncbi:MAG TPA: heterodisulfide reductase-related iron-sulfur binding cluster [Streptosporangiaceae bacterium]|jgi:glycolate oxidase iron-sulfur subunit